MANNRDIFEILTSRGIDQKDYQALLGHGGRHGKLSREELVDIIPDVEFDGPLAEEFMQSVSAAGIQVADPEELLFPDETELLDTGSLDQALLQNEASLEGFPVDDVLRIYLREATQLPLLNIAEEGELARRIERCREAHQELSLGNVTDPRHRELQNAIEEGHAAREHLIRANTRLVISIAKRYNGHGLAFSDLIQEGNIGLMRAIRHFDYRRGFKFSTYATWWVRQAISRALADQSRAIRLPAYLSDQMSRLRRTQLDLQQRLGRSPSVDELAEVMEIPAARILHMLESSTPPVSLEAPVNDDQEAVLGDLLEDTNATDPEEAVMDSMESEAVRVRLQELPSREREVLTLRYGIGGIEPLTLAKVGERLGITRERARQLELQALERLRNPEAANRKRRGPNKNV